MKTEELKKLTELNDRLALMEAELSTLQHNTSIATDLRALTMNISQSGRSVYLNKVPNLKEKVFGLVIFEYEREYNRLRKEYEELTICKPNGKIATFKPVEL